MDTNNLIEQIQHFQPHSLFVLWQTLRRPAITRCIGSRGNTTYVIMNQQDVNGNLTLSFDRQSSCLTHPTNNVYIQSRDVNISKQYGQNDELIVHLRENQAKNIWQANSMLHHVQVWLQMNNYL